MMVTALEMKSHFLWYYFDGGKIAPRNCAEEAAKHKEKSESKNDERHQSSPHDLALINHSLSYFAGLGTHESCSQLNNLIASTPYMFKEASCSHSETCN